MDLHVITEIAEYFEQELDYSIPERTPFVGRNFNSTRAGIHADGLLKDEEIYNIFNTEKLLGRPAGVMIGAHSGAAGIAHWINSHFKLRGGLTIDKHADLVIKMKDAIDKDFAEGRTTTYADPELETIIREVDSDAYLALIHHRRKVISHK